MAPLVSWRLSDSRLPIHRTGRLRALGTCMLTGPALRLTLYYMKTRSTTIRLDRNLERLLARASRRSGRNRSEIAREAQRRQLRLSQFEVVRQRLLPFAEARGFLTDEDVFAEVS